MEYIIVSIVVVCALVYAVHSLKKEISGKSDCGSCSSCPATKKKKCSDPEKKNYLLDKTL